MKDDLFSSHPVRAGGDGKDPKSSDIRMLEPANKPNGHVEIKEIGEGFYWYKGEMVIFESGMTFHVAQGPFIEEGVREEDLSPVGYLLRTRRPPMQINPDELIKPMEALEMFCKEEREDNAEPPRTMPEYTTLYSFVAWLANNHFVIIKDPTR